MTTTKIPAIVLGGTGYVAGELLRLIAGHPQLRARRRSCRTAQPGELVGKAFPHLAARATATRRSSRRMRSSALIAELPQLRGVLRRASWRLGTRSIDSLLKRAEAAGTKPRVVDISADFRFARPQAYEAVYKHRARRAGSHRAIHLRGAGASEASSKRRTSRIRAASPRRRCSRACRCSSLGLVEPTLFLSGITGSTGSGRKPVEGTHHPLRHSDLYSYNALAHRHTPEIAAVAKAASGRRGGVRLRAALRARSRAAST